MKNREDAKKIINLQLERDLREYKDPQIAAMVRENETFVGVIMDDKKSALIDEIRKECEAIRRCIPAVKYYAEDKENTHRHTCASLTFPSPCYISNENIKKHLSRLFEIADAVALTDNGGVYFSFKVLDLWR